jgi:hypothetical protein
MKFGREKVKSFTTQALGYLILEEFFCQSRGHHWRKQGILAEGKRLIQLTSSLK